VLQIYPIIGNWIVVTDALSNLFEWKMLSTEPMLSEDSSESFFRQINNSVTELRS